MRVRVGLDEGHSKGDPLPRRGRRALACTGSGLVDGTGGSEGSLGRLTNVSNGCGSGDARAEVLVSFRRGGEVRHPRRRRERSRA